LSRNAPKYGGDRIKDLINNDGLTDAYTNYHMGTCAELIIQRSGITREAQDEYSEMSYKRAKEAWNLEMFKNEVDGIKIETNEGIIQMDRDEEFLNKPKNIPSLRPLFAPDPATVTGTVTVGNTSKLGDGACALLLASENAIGKYSLKPLAEIVAHSDAAMESIDFTTAVVIAIQKLLKKTKGESSSTLSGL